MVLPGCLPWGMVAADRPFRNVPFRSWQLDVMAKRHQFPESSSEIHRGDEEARETTPAYSKGGRLMDDPQNLGMEQVPKARLWEQSQPRVFPGL